MSVVNPISPESSPARRASGLRLLVIIHVVLRYRLYTLLPHSGWVALLKVASLLYPPAWLTPPGKTPADNLRLGLEALGPFYIKLGQLLSTRHDLFDEPVIDALSQLQDQVPPFSSDEAVAIIERELKAPIREHFEVFERVPMASASVAQVHAATLHGGREVVVKVLRPEVRQQVTADMDLLEKLAGWLERLWPDARLFKPAGVIASYRSVILAELDLLQEAHNAQQMRDNFPYSPLLFIPPVHHHLTTHRVMVSDRIEGIPVNDVPALQAAGIDLQVLAERGVEIFFTQVFRDNFFHADMHPGNIFVSPDHPENPRYMAVDCAIVGTLSDQDQLLLARLALLVMQQDYVRIVELIARAGWTPRHLDVAQFAQELKYVADPVFNQPLAEIDFAALLFRLLELARRRHIQAPIQYLLLVKTLIHVEGLGRQIYPELDIWRIGRPLLERWLMERMGPAHVARQLAEKLPEWLSELPELPGLVHDSLQQLNQLQNWMTDLQEKQQAWQRSLRYQLAGLGLGISGLVTGGVLAAQGQNIGVWLVAGGLACFSMLLLKK